MPERENAHAQSEAELRSSVRMGAPKIIGVAHLQMHASLRCRLHSTVPSVDPVCIPPGQSANYSFSATPCSIRLSVYFFRSGIPCPHGVVPFGILDSGFTSHAFIIFSIVDEV